MTSATQKARVRWGSDRQHRLSKAVKSEAGRKGEAMARKMFAAEGRRAKRLYEKQQRAKQETRP